MAAGASTEGLDLGRVPFTWVARGKGWLGGSSRAVGVKGTAAAALPPLAVAGTAASTGTAANGRSPAPTMATKEVKREATRALPNTSRGQSLGKNRFGHQTGGHDVICPLHQPQGHGQGLADRLQG